jgi:hypothetical protein
MKFATLLGQRSILGCLLFSILCGLPGVQPVPAEMRQSNGSIAYQEIKPVRRKVDLAKLNIENALMDDQRDIDDNYNCAVVAKDLCLAIGRETKPDGHDLEYGLRLFLIKTNNSEAQVLAKSTGGMDTWGMMPKFYRHPDNGSLVVLAEDNFEDFDGVRIFSFRQNALQDIGRLRVSLIDSSILPFVLVAQEDQNITFRFNRDLYREHDPGSQAPTEKYKYNQIYYTFDGKVLQEFLNGMRPSKVAQSNRNFPDQILLSKTIQGKFINVLWGDYLYAKISTAKGEKTFLIDGNESCFLQQYPKESLKIDYDVVDRYTPQASGYRRVNIIRNVTTRRTNLQKWRRTVTKKTLAVCERNEYK